MTLASTPSFGQVDSSKYSNDEFELYQFYRKRFLLNFISIGPEKGQSIPAHTIYHRGQPTAFWGDGTIDMGWYLSVLATEYAINDHFGLDSALNAVTSELYYALKATERLDSLGNTFVNMPTRLDGFFIRDDVPTNLFSDGPGFKTNLSYLGIKDSSQIQPLEKVVSDYQTWERGKPEAKNKNIPPFSPRADHHMLEMSQDQVIGLFTGFKMVMKFIPNREIEVHLLNGESIFINLHKMASREGARVFLWCERDFPFNGNTSKFDIYCPDGQLATPGGKIYFFQEPIVRLGVEFLTYNPDLLDTIAFLPTRKRKGGHTAWNICQVQPSQNDVNWTMIAKLAAITDTWTSIGLAPYPNKKSNTQEALEKRLTPIDWHTLYCLMHGLLFDIDVSQNVEQDAIKQLKEAPTTGPYDFGKENYTKFCDRWGLDTCVTAPYSYQNRFKKQKELNYNPSLIKHRVAGFYNGLDYMLLHNLFVLYSIRE